MTTDLYNDNCLCDGGGFYDDSGCGQRQRVLVTTTAVEKMTGSYNNGRKTEDEVGLRLQSAFAYTNRSAGSHQPPAGF